MEPPNGVLFFLKNLVDVSQGFSLSLGPQDFRAHLVSRTPWRSLSLPPYRPYQPTTAHSRGRNQVFPVCAGGMVRDSQETNDRGVSENVISGLRRSFSV